MSITASTMILSALRMIGEKPPGGTLTSAEQTDYLYDLNAAMESWSLDRTLIYQLLQESLALTTGDGTYTIGSSGDFNTTRPTKIVDPCFIRDASGNDYPLTIINAEAYGLIVDKDAGNAIPDRLFYDSAYVSGLGTIHLYPEPSASLTLYINSWKQLQQFSLISTALAMPPGYQLAIESNFAVMKAAGSGARISESLAKTARDSMARVRSVNLPTGILRMPAGVARGQVFDINTGD